MRLEKKTAIVVGGGQQPGDSIGNGKATCVLFAREGAHVAVIDNQMERAQDTVSMIKSEGGQAFPLVADVTSEAELKKMIADAHEEMGRIDILHNNVGFSLAGGDTVIDDITEENFDRVMTVNLRGMVMTCKHVLPIMRAQKSGAIISISSMAAIESYPYVTYKTSKAGVVAMTEQLAYMNFEHGIRANVILPGLMHTAMAIDARVTAEKSRDQVIAERNAKVPLGNKMGTAWDVAYLALFLASDEAKFITGVSIPVDGGASVRRG
ncbi:MAG: 3-oxoacyl-ACP reductase [Rhodospirillaceae bacterium]|nr:3-oxoacyl-ACP reductase [Rhodospirillaceae bacterium]|tara:strand:+ start:412 stop:1209 length:798 start_codon:yes stop_codon:yes gene_type:complete